MANDILQNYINSVSTKYAHEETSEMGYRTDFELLLKGVFESINVSRFDHDARAKQGNKPDFVVLKNDVPILYIETKDIGVSLDKIEKSEQMSRYFGYANLALTDYVEFRFYRNGIAYGEPIKIAEYNKSTRAVSAFPNNFEYLAKTLIDFTQSHREPIKSGKHLAKIMGGKGQRIRDNIKDILASESGRKTELMNVYETLKRLLVHDLTPDSFADMYSQTLVYGLFVARFYDNSLGSFSRQEARDLIPASNPFLGHFFDHIAGRNFEKRLSYIVDELCEVFTHANVANLMEQHFKAVSKKGAERGQDQVIHFYEDFLKEYDEDLRKRMGAYYTPLPVVQFIVRSVDHLLEKEFGLSGGLANTSKTKDGLHRVQVLDPAVGTGTFISDVIGKIYKRIKDNGQKGRWPAYVHHELLPRIYGFELMMAPYTIAHLKLSMALKETGFLYFNETRTGKARLGIYLTNSLEEVNKQPELLAFDFGASIAEEAKQASKIKNEKPIMVVVGNPPYSVSSSNKGEWIQNLIKVYKQGLNERKINLDDDYIKFIRFAEYFIEKNGSGIVAMITNNSFIDGITHRKMREHLLNTFDDIYILDLHGNAKKRETALDGSKDENVFDIQLGVSINIFIRKNIEKHGLGKVFHADLYGKRAAKFDFLNNNNLTNIKWDELQYSEPYFFFVPKDFSSIKDYEKGFKIDELFTIGTSGAESAKDGFIIKYTAKEVESLKDFIQSHSEREISEKYNLKISKAQQVKQDIENTISDNTEMLYRPFDIRITLFSPNSGGLWWRPRYKVMKNMLGNNLGLIAKRGFTEEESAVCFCSNKVIDRRAWSRPGMQGAEQLFPLYLIHEDGTKTPNLNQEIAENIEEIAGEVIPEDIFDYIYAVLHSPNYRVKYKEFLKIDFPRIPYPSNKKTFLKLVSFGKDLRLLHLLESPKINNFITTYSESGSDTVEKIEFKDGNVYINENQYFGSVPEVAWNFWIGGYQPAQKWLKDRKGKTLTNEDIEHYQKMIVALVETDKVMKEIDKVIEV